MCLISEGAVALNDKVTNYCLRKVSTNEINSFNIYNNSGEKDVFSIISREERKFVVALN